jgi:hypothetical protein
MDSLTRICTGTNTSTSAGIVVVLVLVEALVLVFAFVPALALVLVLVLVPSLYTFLFSIAPTIESFQKQQHTVRRSNFPTTPATPARHFFTTRPAHGPSWPTTQMSRQYFVEQQRTNKNPR